MSAAHDPLVQMAKLHQVKLTLCFVETGASSVEEVHFEAAKALGEVYVIERFRPFRGSKISSDRSGNQLLGEILFWKKNWISLKDRKFDAVIVHSESLLSDLLAVHLPSAGGKRVLLNTLNDLSEHYLAVSALIRKRVKSALQKMLSNELAGDNVIVLAIKSSVYRVLAPVAAHMIMRESLQVKLARRFVSGELCDSYLVGPLTARRLSMLPGAKRVLAVDPEPEQSQIVGSNCHKNTVLVILSEPPPTEKMRKAYANALVHDLSLVQGQAFFNTVLLRPHPRFQLFVDLVARSISGAGWAVKVLRTDETIADACSRADIIAGVWSSALFQAASLTADPTYGLLSPSLIEDPDLVIDRSKRVRWYPPELLESFGPDPLSDFLEDESIVTEPLSRTLWREISGF